MLTKYLKGKSKTQFAKKIGITRQHLDNILKKKEPNLSVATCIKIESLTGLKPWDYLDLSFLKEITKRLK